MIYLFNDVKELTGTVRNNHILNLLYEREKNGIYSVSAEIPVTYNDQGTIYNYNKKVQKSDFLGHYDKEGRFQLHKIAAVDIENGSIFVKGIHIFFDEAKAGAIIQDRRFINREIIDGARVAFESIGWSVADFDVSVGKTYNFYNVTPLEARQILVETFGFEFDYWLDFDGKKVTNRHVAVKEKIGEKTNKRYTYGHNVLNIRAEQDYSEIYTAVIGRGKGEEIEETGGYGRRIEYTDVVWTTPSKPLNKPAGTRVLEDTNATQLFGYKENGEVKPRVKVEVFSDIESPTELIQASYEWLMDNNVPKAVFSLKVADGDGLNLGDEVYVIYRDIDLIKSARVEKVTDDLVSGNRDVEFGDTAYFDTDRRLSGLRADLKRNSGETGDRIYRLKMEFNRRFDEEVSSWVAEFEQNLIDQKALIEADRENMTNLINTKTEEFDASLAAGMADAERKRQENYDAMSDYVNTSVDTTRSELGTDITLSIEEAERIAQLEYEAIRGTITSTISTTRTAIEKKITDSIAETERKAQLEHAAIEKRVTDNVDIARIDLEKSMQDSITETERKAQLEHDAIEQRVTDTVDTTREVLELSFGNSVESAKQYAEQQAIEKADAVKTSLEIVTEEHQQMLQDLESNVLNIDDFLGDSRSVTLDERFHNIALNFEERIRNVDSTHYNMIRGTSFDNEALISKQASVEFITNETDIFARLGLGTTNVPYIMPVEYFHVEQDQTYHLMFTYRTNDVPEIDYAHLRPPSGYGGDLVIEEQVSNTDLQTVMTGQWSKKVYTFVSDRSMPVRLLLGTNFGAGNTQRGTLDIKKPYLTTTNNREWLPHPDDDTQNVSEIVRRVTLLEDGQSELITRTEYDFETGQLDQYIKSVEDTVEGNKTVIQRVEDWQATNGASIEETIYGFDQKVWLNDVANIGANLIPQSSKAWEDGGLWIEGGTDAPVTQNIRTKERIKIQPSTTYTLSSNSLYVSAIERVDIHQYLTTGGWINRRTIPRNGQVTFTTWGTADTVRITLVAREGFTINTNFVDLPDGRVKIKLEVGLTATPMLNAISRIEQLANSVSIQVQEMDGEFLYQSDITVQPDYVQLGSQRINGDSIGSLLRVSPTGIDMVAEAMRLSGDLYVDGDITALAIAAVEGNFARLFATEFDAVTITAEHIGASTISIKHLTGYDAILETLMARTVFTENVMTKAITAIEGEFASLFAAQLSATTITGDLIASRTITSENIHVDHALVNRIMAQSVYANDVTAKIGNFIDLNAGTIRSSILTANTIETSMLKASVVTSAKIKVDDVLVNRIIAQSVYADDVTSKIGTFIDLNVGTIRSSILTANTIETSMLKAEVVTAAKLKVDKALVDKLSVNELFANMITSKAGDFIDLNAGEIVTAGLSANVITSDHIQVGTALIDKMFATSARIDQLITKTHFVNEMNALTMNVIDLNASQIRTRLLSANTIEAEWIKSGTALLDRVFSTTAMFERMMAKSGFVTTLNTVTIDTDQITIRRPDGGALISQGMQRFGAPIITKPFMTGDVYFENQNYVTGSRGAETFEVAFAEHSGRWATFNFNISLRHNSKDASALVGVVVRRGTSPPGVHIAHKYEEFMAYRDSGSRSYNVEVPMPVPTYGAVSWTLEFYVIGDLGNFARIRSGRCWISG